MNQLPLKKINLSFNPYLETTPAVCLTNVTVVREKNEVLSEIDLCVEEGVFLGVIGPNGGGKTTLLKTILGSIKPVQGKVEVFGQKPSMHKRRKDTIGYVPQVQTIPEYFPATVYDVVLMGAYGTSPRLFPVKREYKDHAHQLIEQVRLEHVYDRPISQLSGGQQQRAFIARALVTHPRLLLLDEPLRGVDTTGQSHFFDLLTELKRQYDLTVIMVSHNISSITRFSDKIACLNRKLHWHDRSELIDHTIINRVYKCELEAMFIQEEQIEQRVSNPFHKGSDPSKHEHV